MTDGANVRQLLIDRLRSLAANDGFTAAPLDGITYMRADTSQPKAPVLQEPSFVLLAQGMKRGYLGAETYTYHAGQCLVVTVPMPFDCDTQVGPDGAMLAVAVRIDSSLVSELLLTMDAPPQASANPGERGMMITDMTPGLVDALNRLLAALASPMDTRVLGAGLLRELHYQMLLGPAGECLRSLVSRQGRLGRVRRSIDSLYRDPAAPFSVAALAAEAGMSQSGYHQAFREVTGHAPMQYLKNLRLHRARQLIVQQGFGSAQAAYEVGYASATQFSREFKRLFGCPPSAIARQPSEAAE
ncbi:MULTISPECIES: AraC family transcriptional regulator [unclassified Pseudomonas]|uniref:AraC family transcriptional regulator n=1 Tax=unclassified Pseudomonas TaxID=196821 RepID=UPI001483CB50|nr:MULTISPECIES: AraC family transcriptional regulator [unclassified Pseudomonas]